MTECKHCGKTDFDIATGCIDPIVYSPGVGDWYCKMEQRGGKRPGAGRPYSDEPRIKTSITIRQDDKTWLKNRPEKTSELIDRAFELLRQDNE